MAWKNLRQQDLSDALLSHHEALEELDDVPQIESELSHLNTSESFEAMYRFLKPIKSVEQEFSA